jgi:hypothetical protein
MNDMNQEVVVRFDAGGPKPQDPRFAKIWGSVRYSRARFGQQEEVLFEFGERTAEGIMGRSSELDRGVFVLQEDFYARFGKLFEGL